MDKLIAHRGFKEKAKENTLDAFLSALEIGFGGFECDVRQTKDGIFIIFHDPLLDGKLVKNYSYKEIKKMGVISLADVLKINTDKMIVLDIKDPFLNTQKFHQLINKEKRNIYVMSFYDRIINKLSKLKRNYEVGILNYVLNTQEEHFSYDFLCLIQRFASKVMIEKYEKLGKKLFIYAVNAENKKYDYPYYIVD